MELNELKAYLKSLPNIIDGKGEFRIVTAISYSSFFSDSSKFSKAPSIDLKPNS